MRQHVNPLSKNYEEIEVIPPLNQIFEDPKLPLHLDIGCAAGNFLFDLALEKNNWNYLGIEIRKQLIKNAKLRITEKNIRNLYFSFGNANNILNAYKNSLFIDSVKSISFNFPDPWFKKKHYKRRVIQPALINFLSKSLKKGSLIFIKTDVKELFDYMNLIISKNLNFKQLENKNFNYSNSFNPNKIKTNREKYVILNNLNVFESIYLKI